MKTSNRLLAISAATSFALHAFPWPVHGLGYSLTVPATANISSAGLASPVAPGGFGAGTLPVAVQIPSQQLYFQLDATGSVAFDGIYRSADGRENYASNILPYGGISGFRADVMFPLTGVFLTDAPPQAPAPVTLDFRSEGLGLNFSEISPGIGQIFFVGDGRDAMGSSQRFNIPPDATRLFLGFADAFLGQGEPGAFEDNTGWLSVTVTFVPEPSAPALLLTGILVLFGRLRRK